MEVITREITLNVDRFVRTRQTVRFAGKVGDHNARRIVAHILNGATPLALDRTETVLLHCARRNPQTLEIQHETFLGSIREDGRVEVTLPVWVFTYPGMVDCEFAISTSSQTVSTEDFLIQSLEAVRADAEPAQDEEVDILAELIAEAREVLGEIGNAHGLPEVTAADEGKIVQVKNGAWNKQHPELGEETIHFLTNLEIEALLSNSI